MTIKPIHDRFTLTITGTRLKTLITQRVGALENEIAAAKLAEDEARAVAARGIGVGQLYHLGQRDALALDKQRAALTLVHGLTDDETVYAMTLTDLASLDLIDVHLKLVP